jgi:hypothetical protein
LRVLPNCSSKRLYQFVLFLLVSESACFWLTRPTLKRMHFVNFVNLRAKKHCFNYISQIAKRIEDLFMLAYILAPVNCLFLSFTSFFLLGSLCYWRSYCNFGLYSWLPEKVLLHLVIFFFFYPKAEET